MLAFCRQFGRAGRHQPSWLHCGVFCVRPSNVRYRVAGTCLPSGSRTDQSDSKGINKNTGQSPHRSIGERTDAAFYFASPTTTWPFFLTRISSLFTRWNGGIFHRRRQLQRSSLVTLIFYRKFTCRTKANPVFKLARAVAPANFRCPIIGRRGSRRGCYDSRTTRAHASACSREKGPLPIES